MQCSFFYKMTGLEEVPPPHRPCLRLAIYLTCIVFLPFCSSIIIFALMNVRELIFLDRFWLTTTSFWLNHFDEKFWHVVWFKNHTQTNNWFSAVVVRAIVGGNPLDCKLGFPIALALCCCCCSVYIISKIIASSHKLGCRKGKILNHETI